MRVFVTGGTGFLGRPLCHALREQRLLVLTRDAQRAAFLAREQILEGDLNDPASWLPAVTSFRPKVCVHLAWEGLPDYSLGSCERNFKASLNLFDWLRKCDCKRIIVTGTCFEYGNLNGCVKEDDVAESVGLFAAFKKALRLAGEQVFARSNQDFLWVRPFFVYGAGQRPTSLVPATYQSLRSGQMPTIKTPNAVNDFIYVDDVAEGIVCLATGSAPGGVYNLGSGQAHRVRDVVNLLARLLGLSDVMLLDGEPGHGFWADGTRMREVGGWQARFSLEEGMRRTIGFLET